MSQFLQLHPSREPCRIAQCKLYSLPLSLFAHFSSALQKTQTCKLTHTHTHTQTLLHRDALVSILLYCCRKKQHYCYYCCCSLGMHCQQKMLLLSTCCVHKTRAAKERLPVCVIVCVQWPCAVSALSCGFITQSHIRTLKKGFNEKSLSCLPQNA